MSRKWNVMLSRISAAGVFLISSETVLAGPNNPPGNSPAVTMAAPANPSAGYTIVPNAGDIGQCYVVEKNRQGATVKRQKSKHFVSYSECMKHRGENHPH